MYFLKTVNLIKSITENNHKLFILLCSEEEANDLAFLGLKAITSLANSVFRGRFNREQVLKLIDQLNYLDDLMEDLEESYYIESSYIPYKEMSKIVSKYINHLIHGRQL